MIFSAPPPTAPHRYTAADDDELTADKGAILVCKECPDEDEWLDAKLYPVDENEPWRMIPMTYVRKMKPEEVRCVVAVVDVAVIVVAPAVVWPSLEEQ